jgi:uncharacterized protein
MKLLAISDKVISTLYGPAIHSRAQDVDLVISCGDLSYYYLEYIISCLDVPLYYVRGNHAPIIEYGTAGPRSAPWGAVDLHQKSLRDKKTGLLMAGIEGSLRYKPGPFQYSQAEMFAMVLKLAPSLMLNKIRYGRFLDLFITHAPPWGIHDKNDLPHKGIKAFNWLINTFQPQYHLHGHIHVYNPTTITETRVGGTLVMNSYGFRKLMMSPQTAFQTLTEKIPPAS